MKFKLDLFPPLFRKKKWSLFWKVITSDAIDSPFSTLSQFVYAFCVNVFKTMFYLFYSSLYTSLLIHLCIFLFDLISVLTMLESKRWSQSASKLCAFSTWPFLVSYKFKRPPPLASNLVFELGNANDFHLKYSLELRVSIIKMPLCWLLSFEPSSDLT